jgi:hypothetical protein
VVSTGRAIIHAMRCARLGFVLLLSSSCGSSTPAPAAAPSGSTSPEPAATDAAAAASAAAPSTPPPVPTGGAVLIGEINAPKSFNPRPAVEALTGQLVGCYNQARAAKPDLHGKITLQISVNEAGAVLSVDAAPGGHANDPALVRCIEAAMKADAHFPKPGGTATVNAPLVFRP